MNILNEFIDISFPLPIPHSSTTGPEYSTSIITTISGNEQRNINWFYPKYKFHIAKGIHEEEQINMLLSFFHLCNGRAMAFRMRDWSDYKAENQLIEEVPYSISQGINSHAEGNALEFQLIKEYRIGSHIVKRKVTKPVIGSVVLYRQDEASENGARDVGGKASIIDIDKYTIDYLSGKVAFATQPESPIYASFTFDIAVRFDIDQLPIRAEGGKIYTHSEIPLIEVR